VVWVKEGVYILERVTARGYLVRVNKEKYNKRRLLAIIPFEEGVLIEKVEQPTAV
jgi:hypothetical protein